MSEAAEKKHRIVELRGSNVKRMRAFVIRPKPKGMTVIAGRNGQGKTSAIDTVQMLFGGAKAIPVEPVRHGARKAEMLAKLNGVTVERIITAKGTDLIIRNESGEVQRSPQELLDALTGGRDSLAFDPVAFSRMDSKKQDETLKRALGLDFSDLDAARAKAFEKRRDVNKEVKRLEAQFDAMPEPGSDVPAAEVSVSELVAEIERRREVSTTNEAQREELRRKREAIRSESETLAELDSEIEALEKRLEAKIAERVAKADRIAVAERQTDELSAAVEALEDPDVSDLREQIKTAEATNAKVRARAAREKLARDIETASAAAEELTEVLKSLDEERAQRLSAAQFPIPGLGFDDAGPTLDGVPLAQASGAEKIRIGVALAAALNPRLRVVLIRDGSLLDDDSMRLLDELLEEHDMQALIERVGTTDPGAVIIEDGEVVEAAGSETAAE